jgi:hypothetical protein
MEPLFDVIVFCGLAIWQQLLYLVTKRIWPNSVDGITTTSSAAR